MKISTFAQRTFNKAAAFTLSASMLLSPMTVMAANHGITAMNYAAIENAASAILPADEAVSVTVSAINPVTEFVTRLYRNFLLREPDASGLEAWVNALMEKRATGAKVVAGFVHSREFQNQPLDDTQYVSAFYRVILGREPDQSGLASWLDVLNRGYTKDKVLEGFLNSPEMEALCRSMGVEAGLFKSTANRDSHHKVTEFVMRLYENCLGRRYDDGGLTNWVDALVSGSMNGYSVTMSFFTSEEMENSDIEEENFINVCYRTLLNREADATGRSTWLEYLTNGQVSPQEVVLGFCKSEEFNSLCASYGIDVFASPLGTDLITWIGKNMSDFRSQLGWMEDYEMDDGHGYTDYRVLVANVVDNTDTINYIVLLSASPYTISGVTYDMNYNDARRILESKYEYFGTDQDDSVRYDIFLVDDYTSILLQNENGIVKTVFCARYEG
jgi:hypothetical protein